MKIRKIKIALFYYKTSGSDVPLHLYLHADGTAVLCHEIAHWLRLQTELGHLLELLPDNLSDYDPVRQPFVIYNRENWNAVLYVAFMSSTSKIISLIYLLIWIFLGNFILLNLFMAVLLNGKH